jgi:hypothetical protein
MEFKMEALMESASKHGFFAGPRYILEAALGGDEQARVLAIILLKVNFVDRQVESGDRRYLCRRGESILSLRQWSELTGLDIPRVRYYFRAFTTAGILERINNPLHGGHIRVKQYDELTGRGAYAEDHAKANTPNANAGEDRLFEAFWELYHEITGRAPIEQHLTRLYWDRLTPEEQEQAYDNFRTYYNTLDNKEYCRKAAMYLKNKSFN